MQAFLIILCLKVEEAMRINTKLKSINVKQESTITALQKVKKKYNSCNTNYLISKSLKHEAVLHYFNTTQIVY